MHSVSWTKRMKKAGDRNTFSKYFKKISPQVVFILENLEKRCWLRAHYSIHRCQVTRYHASAISLAIFLVFWIFASLPFYVCRTRFRTIFVHKIAEWKSPTTGRKFLRETDKLELTGFLHEEKATDCSPNSFCAINPCFDSAEQNRVGFSVIKRCARVYLPLSVLRFLTCKLRRKKAQC